MDAFLLCMPAGAGAGREYLIADTRSTIPSKRSSGPLLGPWRCRSAFPHYPVLPVLVAGHIIEKLCKPFGVTAPILPRRVDWYRQNRAFDIGRARRELGFHPRVELDEGLRRTGEWYRQMGYL
jgi:2-alkyl-3-oxoalkanoate reductase